MTSSFAGLARRRGRRHRLVYLLIVVNFQSWLDPFIIITALPGALAGILWMLLPHAHHTQRALAYRHDHVHGRGHRQQHPDGVLRARADGRRPELHRRPRCEAGYVRMRPVLMTAMAMIIGMVPMSLGTWRRRRAERSAGPRRDRRPDRGHIRNSVFCSLRVFAWCIGTQAGHFADCCRRGRCRNAALSA